MIYGYAQILTEGQDLDSLSRQLKAAGCEQLFLEKISGEHANRPQLNRLLRVAKRGDSVKIPAVDRLSRTATDLLVIARHFEEAGVALQSLAEPIIDTASDFREVILAIFGVAAKLELGRIRERTKRGRADAKAKGVKFGRKPKLTAHQTREAVRRRDIDGETLRSIARSYNVSAATIYRLPTQTNPTSKNVRGTRAA
jgi:DNA invertase Pin-like site-specific DNA recombinase